MAGAASATCSWPSTAAPAPCTWRSRGEKETEAAAKAFLEEAVAAFPFRVTRLLTDRGSCFTAEGFEKRCRERGRAPQDQALHAAHERHGRALRRSRAAEEVPDHEGEVVEREAGRAAQGARRCARSSSLGLPGGGRTESARR